MPVGRRIPGYVVPPGALWRLNELGYLSRLEPEVQKRLINWGYAVCDAAMRKHVDQLLPAPAGFPYPEASEVE